MFVKLHLFSAHICVGKLFSSECCSTWRKVLNGFYIDDTPPIILALAKTKTKTKAVQTDRENNQHGGMNRAREKTPFPPLLFIFVRPISDNVTWHTLLILAEWRACPAICLGHCCSLRSALFPCPPSTPPFSPLPFSNRHPACAACLLSDNATNLL